MSDLSRLQRTAAIGVFFTMTQSANLGSGRVKHRIRHKCGHERTHQVFEAPSLEPWREQLEASDCTACWLKKQPPQFSRRTAQSGVLAVDVLLGYPIKEQLKDRGYWFQRPRWIKHCSDSAEQDQEIAWAQGSGFSIAGRQEWCRT